MTKIDDLERERDRLVTVLKLTPDDVDEILAVCRDLQAQVNVLLLLQAARRKRDQKKLN